MFGLTYNRGQKGFTLIELLVIIAIIGILASLLLSGLAAAKSKAYTITCLNNKKQLAIAWHLYANDSLDKLCPNSEANQPYQTGNATTANWVAGKMSWQFDGPGTDVTNTTLMVSESESTLGVYTKTPKIYKCPADKFLASKQKAAGFRERVRSVSMNLALGPGNGNQDNPKPPTSSL